jgi:hypothetical protein
MRSLPVAVALWLVGVGLAQVPSAGVSSQGGIKIEVVAEYDCAAGGPLVKVTDQTGKPRARAEVHFLLPDYGVDVSFKSDTKMVKILTGDDGRAPARLYGLKAGPPVPEYEIAVIAAAEGQRTSALIRGATEPKPVEAEFSRKVPDSMIPEITVVDSDGRAVPRASAHFQCPNQGAGCQFQTGDKTYQVPTDANGRAKAVGLKANAVVGEYQIVVVVRSGDMRERIEIWGRNKERKPGWCRGACKGTLAVAGVGATVVGVILATRGNGGNGNGKPPTVSVTFGQPTITPPAPSP